VEQPRSRGESTTSKVTDSLSPLSGVTWNNLKGARQPSPCHQV